MHKEYITPRVRLRSIDWEYNCLASPFSTGDNETIEEDKYEW